MTTQLTRKGTQDRTNHPASPADHGRIREVCHRIHLTIQDMNYASRRLVEVQAPWSAGTSRDSR
jgi:hypothetical protein